MPYIKNWFSNMLPMDTPYIVGDMQFKTVENYYQAMKFGDEETVRRISNMDPYEAKRYAAKYRGQLHLNDQFDRLMVMETALRHKFAKGTSWHKKLMETEGEIVEWNNWHDQYWGKTGDGVGENHLGKLLMKIRDSYKYPFGKHTVKFNSELGVFAIYNDVGQIAQHRDHGRYFNNENTANTVARQLEIGEEAQF